jgi:hypothetical protein
MEIVADQLDQGAERVFASARWINWSGDGLSRARTGEAAQRFLLTKTFSENQVSISGRKKYGQAGLDSRDPGATA